MDDINIEITPDPVVDALVARLWKLLPTASYAQRAWKSMVIEKIMGMRGEGLSEEQLLTHAMAASFPDFVVAAWIQQDWSKHFADERTEEALCAFVKFQVEKARNETPEQFKARWAVTS